MSLETRKVLDMLAEGKISAVDAEKLLEKLQGTATEEDNEPATAPAPQDTKRYLRIVVDEPGRKQVNIRMPLGFLRSGVSLLGILPVNVAEKLKERGIDIGAFHLNSRKDNSEILAALNELNLDVDKGDGKKVRIYCE